MIGNLARRREQTENEAVDSTDLRTRRTPVRLAFANHMNRFVTGDGAPRTPERAEMLARVDPTLDRPVILFQDLLRYCTGRCWQMWARSPAAWSTAEAGGKAACLSVLMTRGEGW